MEINGMEVSGNYVKVLDKHGNVNGYIVIEDDDKGLSIDNILRNMGLDPDLTYYRFVEKRPEGMPLERKGSWRDVKSWNDVVKACERNGSLHDEYMETDGGESYFPWLAYGMVKYAIDGGCRSQGYGYVPQLAITEEGDCPGEEEDTYLLVGKLRKDGVAYDVFQVPPSLGCGSPVIDTYLKSVLVPFNGIDWIAVSSAEKAMHVSAYFAKELLAVIYGGVGYEWEDA